MSSEIKANLIQDKTGTRVLASDSGSAWSWGSGVPAGTCIQMVTHNADSGTNTTNTSNFVTTGLAVSITPKYDNSKMVILWQTGTTHFNVGGGNSQGYLAVSRDASTTILTRSQANVLIYNSGTTTGYFNFSGVATDTVTSTTAIAYTLMQKSKSGTFFAIGADTGSTTGSSITVMEFKV